MTQPRLIGGEQEHVAGLGPSRSRRSRLAKQVRSAVAPSRTTETTAPPGTTTKASIGSIDLATNVPAGSIGIGGSPGESVFVKAGAASAKPLAEEGSNRHLRMNIDKGNQGSGGASMVVLGNVAHPAVVDMEYRVKALDNAGLPLSVTTDGEGRVWLIVGTDSGFEGLSRLYYARISYTLSSASPPVAAATRRPSGRWR